MYPLSFLVGFNRFKEGAWFEPSEDDRLTWMLELLDITPSDTCIDIGSGDGRVVMAMAMLGARSFGIERDLKLVELSRRAIRYADLEKRAQIYRGDMRQHWYKPYSKVCLYQFKTVMSLFEQKLLSELPVGAKVVSNYWKFPYWQIADCKEDVYLYVKK